MLRRLDEGLWSRELRKADGFVLAESLAALLVVTLMLSGLVVGVGKMVGHEKELDKKIVRLRAEYETRRLAE
ncbi:MAG: hypothetical protein LBN08_03980 [Lactobacillales bacterium]|nr:hypothetical protein [Lactobacillales bacterium]